MQTQPESTHQLELIGSPKFSEWLYQQHLSLAFTTYQTNRLFLLGIKSSEKLSVFERHFNRPMGLYGTPNRLYMGCRYQLWELENILATSENPSAANYNGYDQLYVPKRSYTTGDINIHDVVVLDAALNPQIAKTHPILFVNTQFSCLATLDDHYSFVPTWKPPFISKLAAEDRCHLNGLAMVAGVPGYVTAVSASNEAAGWRQQREAGGIAMDISSNEIICQGLSMPHSPRFYQDRLWILNSGTGDFGYVDFAKGTLEPVTFCPGFVRGVAFYQDFAIVGLSKPRSRNFAGLAIDERLAAYSAMPRCGIVVIDLKTGNIIHWLYLEGVVKELFDVVVLPGVRQPMALGFQGDEIERLVTFPGSPGIVSIKPTVSRQQVPGNQTSNGNLIHPTLSPSVPQSFSPMPVKYQRVYHLNAENSLEYDALTFPSIKKRWQTLRQRGELLAISASINEQIVGFVIAEILPETETAEVISFLVLPPYRHQGIGTTLVRHLEEALIANHCQHIQVSYQVTAITQTALEPLLKKLNWQPPKTTFFLGKTTTQNIAKAPWLSLNSLPDGVTIFPWVELTAKEQQTIRQRADYPAALNPFSSDPRLEPLNSLGLRDQETVIGWCVTHRVAADTIRYSSLFVQEKYQKFGRAITLLTAAIKLQIASSIPNYTFSVAIENPQMKQFLHRRLQPYLTLLTESRQSGKLLGIKEYQSVL